MADDLPEARRLRAGRPGSLGMGSYQQAWAILLRPPRWCARAGSGCRARSRSTRRRRWSRARLDGAGETATKLIRRDSRRRRSKPPKAFGRISTAIATTTWSRSDSLIPFSTPPSYVGVDRSHRPVAGVPARAHHRLRYERTVMRGEYEPARPTAGCPARREPASALASLRHPPRLESAPSTSTRTSTSSRFRFNRRHSRRRGLLFHRLARAGGHHRPDHLPQP